jgi:glycosyltransferase involved in cell wall biosynthesis
MVQIRLCIVTHTFLPHVGGIEKVVYEQSKRLPYKQYEPLIITSMMQTFKNYIVDGIKVECYRSLNTGFRLGIPYAIPTINSLDVFFKAIKSSRLVHAHGHPYLTSLIAARLAKHYSKPFVLTQHNTFIEYDSIFETIERLNDLAIGKETLRLADKIIVVSKATKDYVLSLGAKPEKIKVIHNGVDLARFRPLAGKKEDMRRKLGIPQNAIVVITVRRLVYKNGIDTLIESANIVVKKNSTIIFLVVGNGPDFNKVELKIKQLGIEEKFRLTGFVADEDLPLYYNTADFFVLPSKSGEGLPLVALEAMACGLPVIATNVGGIGEIMMEEYGQLVPANNPKLLADAILGLSAFDSLSLKRELRTAMEQMYGWESNVERLVEIYEELI